MSDNMNENMSSLDNEQESPSYRKDAKDTKDSKNKKNKVVDSEVDTSEMLKTKLLLATPLDHPLSGFQMELKARGVKNFDLNELVLSALNEVCEAWWQNKIEELTPLEYRINSALSDPNLRQKLSELLAPQLTH